MVNRTFKIFYQFTYPIYEEYGDFGKSKKMLTAVV